jgi:hypothetical protein
MGLCTGDTALLTTPIRGYRTWLEYSGQLASTNAPCVWDVTMTARCLRRGGVVPGCPCALCRPGDGHDAPCEACACGVYGWYDPSDTRIVPADVFGVIEVSGKVLLGDHGFRAERARLLAVASVRSRGTATRLEAAGVRVYRDRPGLIEDYPRDDLSALVDHVCDVSCRPEAAAAFRIGVVQAFTINAAAFGTAMAKTAAAVEQLRAEAAAAATAGAVADTPSGRFEKALEAKRRRGTGPVRDGSRRRGAS